MYKLVLGDSQIWVAYKNTLIYTVLGTLISLVVTSTGAYALSRSDMALRKSFTLLIVVTMFFSGGMIPTFLVVRSWIWSIPFGAWCCRVRSALGI